MLSLRAVIPAAFLVAQSAYGQSTGAAFPDTPANHWAYQAIQDLANWSMA